MGFLTKKRNVDLVSIVSISVVAVILTVFASWLYYGSKIDKIQSSNEIRIGIIRSSMESMKQENLELQKKLDKVKDAMTETEEKIPE